jgi:hypothetical protein
MSTFVLIPGAGGAAWYWHRVVPELRARGLEADVVPGGHLVALSYPVDLAECLTRWSRQ